MRILFIDLASHHGSSGLTTGSALACVTEKGTESLRTVDHRIGDAGLLPELDACLKAAGWTEKDITQIACVTGPGGFTSLRVAIAFANTLGHALKVPMAGIHLSDLYAVRAMGYELWADSQLTAHSSQPSLLWLHSTKVKEVFVRGFGTLATEWPEAIDVTVESLLPKLSAKTPYIGELIETQRALVEAKSAKPAAVKPLEEILPGYLAGLTYLPGLIYPWYGRGF